MFYSFCTFDRKIYRRQTRHRRLCHHSSRSKKLPSCPFAASLTILLVKLLYIGWTALAAYINLNAGVGKPLWEITVNEYSLWYKASCLFLSEFTLSFQDRTCARFVLTWLSRGLWFPCGSIQSCRQRSGCPFSASIVESSRQLSPTSNASYKFYWWFRLSTSSFSLSPQHFVVGLSITSGCHFNIRCIAMTSTITTLR